MRITTIGSLILAILLLAAAAMLTGCGGGGGGGGSSNTSDGTITGVVRHAGSLAAIGGVKVATGSKSETTDATGKFTLTGVSTGAVTVTATKNKYEAKTVTAPAGRDVRDIGNILLIPSPVSGKANVTGRVTHGGQPVSGATVTCDGVTATTDSAGNYTLYNVSLGSQTIQVRGTDSSGNSIAGAVAVTVTTGGTSAPIAIYDMPPPPPF